MSQFKKAILFFMDGANEEVFRGLLEKGELPNVSRYLVERGTATDAITCFPSTTGPAFTPTMTGCYPGTCNIPGVRWFDRSMHDKKMPTTNRFRDYFNWGIYKYDSDLSKEVRTLYEYMPNSLSILGFVNRGTTLRQRPHFFKTPYLFYRALFKDDAEYVDRAALGYFKKKLKHQPQFVFYYFPIIDLLSHRYRNASKQVIDTYHRMDKDIGSVIDLLKENGTYDETAFILTSDHGHDDVDEHFDVDGFLENKYDHVAYFPKKVRGWKKAKAINMVAGNGMTHIYVQNGQGWKGFNPIENIAKDGLVDELLERKEVAFIMGRSEEGGILLKSKKGAARIKEEGSTIHYQPIGSDPFGYDKLPEKLNHDEALNLTADTAFPDAILQTVQLFRSSKTGDLALAADEKYDLRAGHKEKPEHRSGHGSLIRGHMMVPLVTNFKLPEQHIRTVDIFPTILASVGIEPTHQLDGKSLI